MYMQYGELFVHSPMKAPHAIPVWVYNYTIVWHILCKNANITSYPSDNYVNITQRVKFDLDGWMS